MRDRDFTLRDAHEADVDRMMELYEAVASEGKWIGGEAPVDREQWRQGFLDRFQAGREPSAMHVAEATDDGALIGNLGVESHQGVGDLGMMVAIHWRGHGVGSALMEAGIEWAKESGLHKLVLQVWPHNERAWALYTKFGFVEEGYLRRHYRRRNGQLWDVVMMALVLDESSFGATFDQD
jgi:RimJ/RimL family protein N-acetyltransferase